MSRSWLSIRVDLIGGGGQDLWPRPGRILAAARSHTFAQLATAIDDAFARWDRAHLHRFDLTDGVRIGRPDWDDEAENLLDGRRTTLARLKNDEQFVYEFDFGDSWTHLCTVGPSRIDPVEQLGRRWDGDDGEELSLPGPDPELTDLPPLRPEWGPRPRR